MRVAVLADIHGNVWALDAVLADVQAIGADHVLNLGDCFWGPLAPGRTFERLRELGWPTVRGNQDRIVLEGAEGTTHEHTLSELGDDGAAWVDEHTHATARLGAILACHGTPLRDDVTLIERIEPTHVRPSTEEELERPLAGIEADTEVVVCGHSHRPGALSVGGRLIVNPGSVGLPAYSDAEPHPHVMEAGTPHARWALLERTGHGWRVELHATPYDTAAAVAAARDRNRHDWAEWIRTGRA